jgi:hypothetical protein
MYKISWARPGDRFYRTFVVVPDVNSLFDVYHLITGYGRNDGCAPVDVIATNLDGHEIDMTAGLSQAAAYGTYSSK